MVEIPNRVERWRSIAQSEISRLQIPLPPEHVLAIIWRESNGTAGIVNQSSGASGLMQVMPIALKDYNQNHRQKYTMSQLRSSSTPEIQIRVGTWILSRFLKSAYRYLKRRLGNVPLDDLIKVTDTFYAAGPAAAKRRLDRIERPSWDEIKSNFQNWDRVGPAELVWKRSGPDNWDLRLMDVWLEGGIIDEDQSATSGALIGFLIIIAAWMWFKKK